MDYYDYHQTVTRCMICDEYVFITDYEAQYNCQKICDKCKAAVMKIREEMDQIPLRQCTDDEDCHTYSGLLSED